MGKLIVRVILVAGVIAFFAGAFQPPEKKLRLGKDLSGGVSLIYAVNIRPSDGPDALDRVMQVLKDRVDPTNSLDITFVAQGRDRIEVTMPAPSKKVKALKAAYEAQLDAIQAAEIRPDELERAMRLSPEERETEFKRLASGDQARMDLLKEAADAFDDARSLREAYDIQRRAGLVDEDALGDIRKQIVDAELLYDQKRKDVLGTSLKAEDVRWALSQSDRVIRKLDSKTGEAAELPSPRQRAIQRLREQAPGATEQLDKVIAAYEAYASERTSLDDPEDLKRLLRGAGVLDFRITVDPGAHPEEDRLRRELQEKGPRNARASDARWFKINNIESWYDSVQQLEALSRAPAAFFSSRNYVVEEFDGEYYMLCWDTHGNRLLGSQGNWEVATASQGSDQLGRPAINFIMNARGAKLLGELTRPHVGDRMAVLLDDQVYTAPVLRSKISRTGQISGDFSQDEIRYIVQVLVAGSLQSKLSPEPISQSTIGPDLGLDNLRSGLKAGLWALVAVSAFMIVYYFVSGGIAVIALGCNAVLILGAMALNHAAFTLPGIAGIILTFGMAVDANVLIYERIREELRGGADARAAVRIGYQRALSSIVDGNVTNLIVCVVLGYTGTQEIKGFAITLGIGVVATLFAALVVSRLIFTVLLEVFGWRRISMLPMALPFIERALRPKINWLRLRWVFVAVSTVYVTFGLFMVALRGNHMLDNEFRGGTQVTIQFKHTPDGSGRLTMTRREVQDRVMEIADQADDESVLKILRTADVLPVDPQADGITSDRFKIKTVIEDQNVVKAAITSHFADMLEEKAALAFKGYEGGDVLPPLRDAPVYRVLTGNLGEVIDRPEYRNDVSAYIGGVAILLDQIHLKGEGLSKRPTLAGIKVRLDKLRRQPEYSDTLTRQRDVLVLEGTRDAVQTAVILVRDENLTFLDDEQTWDTEVATREWKLTATALTQLTTLAEVQNFSATIAQTFRARAIVAVVLSFILISIYIWVRFGSMRYSLAAIIALLHDVLTAIGLIALAEIVYDNPATQGIAQSLGILPFKIDLSLIAAILTIVGYSLNDTIIIMDRIRENRGKLPYASGTTINSAINQTISRTIITSGTTFIATLILYIYGGEGVRAFSYALLIGVAVGTYSSIAVAAPLVWSRKSDRSQGIEADERVLSVAGARARLGDPKPAA